MLSNVGLGYQKLSDKNYIESSVKSVKYYQMQVQAIK